MNRFIKTFIAMLIMLFCLGMTLVCYAAYGAIADTYTYNGGAVTATLRNTSGGKNTEITFYDQNGNEISYYEAAEILYDEFIATGETGGGNSHVEDSLETLIDSHRNPYMALTYGNSSYILADNQEAGQISLSGHENDSTISMQAMDDEMYNALSNPDDPNHEYYIEQLYYNDEVDQYTPEDTSNQRGRLIYFANQYTKNSSETVYLHFGSDSDTRGLGTIKIPITVETDGSNDVFSTITGFSASEVEELRDEGEESATDSDSGLFRELDKLIGDMIFGLANLLYNIVQDGLKTFGNNSGKLITIDDLVFDRYSETSIDFWDSSNGSTLIERFKDNISDFYSKFISIAVVGYLIGLLYVGIRILIASTGKQQQRYKDMLMCWVTGVIILFFFPYAIRYAVKINHAIVTYVGQNIEERNVSGTIGFTYVQGVEDSEEAKQAAAQIVQNPFDSSASNADYMAEMANNYQKQKTSAKAFIYLVMVIQFIMFLITYYKRLFMFSFLLVIFPFVAVTYVIDKVGDGSAQGFQAWTKEIMMNVFMQSFHAIVYVFVMKVVFTGTQYNGNWILAIIGITFVFKGEEILRSILGQSGSVTAKSVKETAAKAVASVAIANTITNRVTGSFGNVTKTVRLSRESRSSQKIANELRKENNRRINNNDTTETNTTVEANQTLISMAQLGYGGSSAIGSGLDTLPPMATREGQELMSAARIVANPTGVAMSNEEIINAYSTVLKYSTGGNEETRQIMNQLGLTNEQLVLMKKLEASVAMSALKLGMKDAVDNPEKFRKNMIKINKDLELHLSTILTGSENNQKSPDVLLWKRALLMNAIDVNTSQIRSGLIGNDGEVAYLEGATSKQAQAMSSSKNAEIARGRIVAFDKFIDQSDPDKFSKMFAITTSRSGGDKSRRRLTARARGLSQNYLDSFNGISSRGSEVVGDEDHYKAALKNMSIRDKRELADDIATLKDFSERTHESIEKLEETEADDGYTIVEIQERIRRIKSKVKDNAQVDSIIKTEFDNLSIDDLERAVDRVATKTFMENPLPNESFNQNLHDAIDRTRKEESRIKTSVSADETRKELFDARERIESDRRLYERTSNKTVQRTKFSTVVTQRDATDIPSNVQRFESTSSEGEASTLRQQDAESEARPILTEEKVSEKSTQSVQDRHMISSNYDELSADEVFDFLFDNPEFRISEVDKRNLARKDPQNESEELLFAKGQLMAQDNREKVSNVLSNLLEDIEAQDSHDLAPQFEGKTAEDYEEIARQKRKEAITQALKLTDTVASGVVLGTAGGFLNIGMSSSDSMAKEFGAGFLGGAAIATGTAETRFGEGFGEREIEVYNPYDGSYTKVKLKKFGSLVDGEGVIPLRNGERVELDDPRLHKVRGRISNMLIEDYAKKKEARMMKEAQERASRFEDALNYRRTKRW